MSDRQLRMTMDKPNEHFIDSKNIAQQPHHHEILDNQDDVDELPAGYWRSFRFLGSIAAIIMLANCLFVGYVLPVRSISQL